MTKIIARVIEDSVSTANVRLTTMELTYPRYVHSEFMTHRMFSRNASSSRAIPVQKQISAINDYPAVPIYWGANQKGMVADYELQGWRKSAAKALWCAHRRFSIVTARVLARLGSHKQNVNRLLEAHSHIKVIVTSTNWANFLTLRDHKDAMPEIKQLAKEVRHALKVSIPSIVYARQWHMPYITGSDIDALDSIIDTQEFKSLGIESNGGTVAEQALLLASAARCARVSYTTIEPGASAVHPLLKDLELGVRLTFAYPIHASPLEHQGMPDPNGEFKDTWGNLNGWVQFRKRIVDEHVPQRPYSGFVIKTAKGGLRETIRI